MTYDYSRTRIARQGVPRSSFAWDSWDGSKTRAKDYFWPEVDGYDLSGMNEDRFGDATAAEYECREPFHTIVLENNNKDEGGTWKVRIHGVSQKGTFKDEKDIPRVIKKIHQDAQKAHDKLVKDAQSVGKPGWDSEYDGIEVVSNYKKAEEDDHSLYVVFEDPEGVLERGVLGHAVIRYSAGADYLGQFGEKSQTAKYQSLADMEGVLRVAEKLYVRWAAE